MKHLVVGTTDLLLEKAASEFLEKGYEKASLRKIASDSGVSTHTIYTRFGDKAGLFDILVKDTASELCNLITLNPAMNDEQRINIILNFIYSNYKVFKLIFCKSRGSEYEAFIETLTSIEEKNMKQRLKKENKKFQDYFLIHRTCKNLYLDFYEIVEKDYSLIKAKEYMKHINLFRNAGWKAILENKK